MPPVDPRELPAVFFEGYRAVRDRVKGVLLDFSLAEAQALRQVALLLPSMFRHPAGAAARIVRGGETYETPGFRDTAWKLHAPLRTGDGREGAIDIVYVRDPATPGGPFLPAERTLLESLAALVAVSLDRRSAHERLSMALTGSVRLWDWDLLANRLTWPDVHAGNPPRVLSMTFEEAVAHIHPDDRELVKRTVDDTLRGPRRRDHIVVECRVAWTGPEYRWRHITGRVHRDPERRPVRMLGLSLDIHEQRALQDRLRQLEKMEALGRLAGGISHDYNNVLVTILGFGKLALDKLAPDHPARNYVEQVVKGGETAQHLVRQIVAFSRRQELKPRRIDLRDALGEWDGMIRRLLGTRYTFRIEASPDAPAVLADPGQLFQVVLNLAVNARDAMPSGGTITLRTTGRKARSPHEGAWGELREWAVIEVRDTGAGMAQDVLQHLFEPFFTTKPEGKGTGLGLATVHGIVTQSGGFLEVESQVGRGTLFRVHLPAATP